MPIIEEKPIVQPKVDFKPEVQSKERQSVFVDNKQIPTSNLQSYVSGYNFTVDYYHQMLNKDSALKSQDVGDSSLFQQYRKIKNLEIKVNSPNTSDQNDEDKVFVTRGSAVIHNGLIPNEGDMFAAPVGDGRLGVYNVTRSQRLSIMADAVYQIEYSLSYFKEAEPEKFKQLEEKVNVSVYYVKEYLAYNKSPLLIEHDYNTLLRLRKSAEEMASNMFLWFFSNEYKALLIPGQTNSILDLYLQDFFKMIVGGLEVSSKVQHFQSINIQDDNYLGYPQIFEALKYRDLNKLKIANDNMGVASTRAFHQDPMMENIRYTGIDYIVYPISNRTHDDDKYNRLDKGALGGFVQKTFGLFDKTTPKDPVTGDYLYPTIAAVIYDDKTLPLINEVNFNGKYVFSEAFYDCAKNDTESDNLSLIEVLVLNYLRDKNYSPAALELLTKDYKNWSKLNQFYFIPIMIVLILSQTMEM